MDGSFQKAPIKSLQGTHVFGFGGLHKILSPIVRSPLAGVGCLLACYRNFDSSVSMPEPRTRIHTSFPELGSAIRAGASALLFVFPLISNKYKRFLGWTPGFAAWHGV
jgi:hypothetical protein